MNYATFTWAMRRHFSIRCALNRLSVFKNKQALHEEVDDRGSTLRDHERNRQRNRVCPSENFRKQLEKQARTTDVNQICHRVQQRHRREASEGFLRPERPRTVQQIRRQRAKNKTNGTSPKRSQRFQADLQNPRQRKVHDRGDDAREQEFQRLRLQLLRIIHRRRTQRLHRGKLRHETHSTFSANTLPATAKPETANNNCTDPT